MPSRWADTADDAAEDARRKAEKEDKKRVKAERQRKAEEEAQRAAAAAAALSNGHTHSDDDTTDRPAKRRRLSNNEAEVEEPRQLLRFAPTLGGPSRSISNFTHLNPIEEGSYGHVSRARSDATNEVVALKKLKLDAHRDAGFPVTALREIQCLRAARGHRHVVDLLEVVCGDSEETRMETWLVMEFLEHDLKTLQETMPDPFSQSEAKTLLLQLTSAVDFLHDHWILHRDLKTSNILLNNRGEIKLADFGMARFVGSPPPKNLTQLVVTLWYRAPELLLGAKEYDGAVDIWSLGCIFGELLAKEPIMQGKNEVEQLAKIFDLTGVPTLASWPNFKSLPNARSLRLPSDSSASKSAIRSRFAFNLTNAGAELLTSMMSLNSAKRPTAKQVLDHAYFREDPKPKPTSLFPTFPSKAGGERRRHASPNAPGRGEAPRLGDKGEVDFSSIFKGREEEERGGGFALKLV